MKKPEIPYYQDYLSENIFTYLRPETKPVPGVPDLTEIGATGGLESKESLVFLCELYDKIKADLHRVLQQRILDRQFIDQRTKACYELNKTLEIDFLDARYETILGQEDAAGRTVIGPKNDFYCRPGGGKPIAEIPEYLKGHHVTLFGPPDDAKLSINAMNAFHRKLKDEPPIVAELLKNFSGSPKWGADDEDSKTPLRQDLISAGQNLTGCFHKNLSYTDPKTKKSYALEPDHLALPIKRFPGLALPCLFLFYRENPLPLHLYDFALHLFANWQNPEALCFYVPKLENEEEARYIHLMIETAEKLIQARHPEYKLGTVRLLIVLENPRAVFRVNEIMDELYPYFAGASLGWHDYLGSTARLFKKDANYRIPVKADPDIVIKYIKASHNLLADVVGSRGGIKVGGMYGILPSDPDLLSPSFQITMRGFIKDVITQMKRNLSGFWVAHPDFVRLGLALVEAWKILQAGDKSKLELLVTSLLDRKYHKDILEFIHGPDLPGLDSKDPLYKRSLLVADIKESTFIANNDPEEIRYNVFQSLQYLTDWLTGSGCVALPAEIDGIPVRVMDDLATAERSRWEVWHELHHNRFPIEDFLRIAHEELHFIRKDLSNSKKIVQVKWDDRTEKWYPIAMELMILLMTNSQPVEFASELLLLFTVDSIRNAQDPWKLVHEIDPAKYSMDPFVVRFNYYFSMCGCQRFASEMAKCLALDLTFVERTIRSFQMPEILEAATFHGNIGENKKTLDLMASQEQALIMTADAANMQQLHQIGQQYLKKFGVKFLISAQGKSGKELLTQLLSRMNNTLPQEIENARQALWEITQKRMTQQPLDNLKKKIQLSLEKHKVTGAAICLASGHGSFQTLCFGQRSNAKPVTDRTWFELASLSKSVATCFALEYFSSRKIPLQTSVNSLFAKTSSSFRLASLDSKHPQWGDAVTVEHLLNHSALNMHYVNGVPADQALPKIENLLSGNPDFGYPSVGVINTPGSHFQYSGGGFLVLEHLLECLEKKSILELTRPFVDHLGLKDFSFDPRTQPQREYATGYLENGEPLPGERKMFPAFAAGATGTPRDMMHFLSHLDHAYHDLKGSGPISHDTAVQMLFGTDKGCQKFMGVNMGLGIFTAEAGPNRLCLHQGANDGFRALFVHCFSGPDRGKGFVILCNAELNGVLFISEVAQDILKEFKIQGIDPAKFQSSFVNLQIPQHELVNIGYRNLLFGAFLPDLPEEILEKGSKDSLSAYNLAVGGKILEVSNQRFARAENLLSAFRPTFDPGLFGKQGKIMDSWESVRHNQGSCDHLVFELKISSAIHFVGISTQYHLGNQARYIRIEGRSSELQPWQEIIPKLELQGHAFLGLKTATGSAKFKLIRVSCYPDGGLTRLGLYGENLPELENSIFKEISAATSIPYPPFHSQTNKPLTPKSSFSQVQIEKNWASIQTGHEVDFASAALGGRIIKASNEHYGPAAQVISPYPPLHMFDGLESARSREFNHREEVVIALGKICRILRIQVDFSYFINNNPLEILIAGLTSEGGSAKWLTLIERRKVKAYAGNRIEFIIPQTEEFSQIKVTAFPDGGMNRIRVLGKR